MRIKILCVGKIKEKYLKDAIEEYAKRLQRYCKLEIIEVADEKTPDKAGYALEEKIKEIEGERLRKMIREDDYVISLAIDGKMSDSLEFAKSIEKLQVTGKSNICFVIGGSLGLEDSLIRNSHEKMSFSKMTFPHQLMRVILLEQIYRSFRIIANEPYHK
ncbi:MAG TPA: 23S rRNA (pseudouridine(1915)-N(3))-methyltransferase RlmH [Lachnospiraceae bacterium]